MGFFLGLHLGGPNINQMTPSWIEGLNEDPRSLEAISEKKQKNPGHPFFWGIVIFNDSPDFIYCFDRFSACRL